MLGITSKSFLLCRNTPKERAEDRTTFHFADKMSELEYRIMRRSLLRIDAKRQGGKKATRKRRWAPISTVTQSLQRK